MLYYGQAPFLECSTIGDKRFSPFCAFIKKRGNTIENIYQAAKIFADGTTGLSWRDAKGKNPVNKLEVKTLYSELWDEYIEENPELLEVIKEQTGLSDHFGRKGFPCQVTELWRIHNNMLNFF